MARDNLNDLAAFVAIAESGSFTRAAARLGLSQSALSHALRGLEERLGVRLLSRTTRSVLPTEAGERLLRAVQPRLEEIRQEVAGLMALRDRPAGLIRITASEHAVTTILYPAIQRLAPAYPEIQIEVSVDNAFADIVAGRFDAGLRLGEQVEKDMVAVRVGPEMRMAVVGSPAYFADRPPPSTPQALTAHNCVCMRLPTRGDRLRWEFEKNGQAVTVAVDGQLTFNATAFCLRAALNGLGLAYCPEDMAADAVSRGRLIRVLEDWCAPFPGYHLYYPSRRQPTAAFTLLVETLRRG